MTSVLSEEEIQKGSGIKIFGRDILSIPCFRKSFLIGIPTGLATSLVYFLFTSKAKMAGHVAFGTIMGVSYSYWFYCRYQFYKVQIAIKEVQESLKEKNAQLIFADSLDETRNLSNDIFKSEQPFRPV